MASEEPDNFEPRPRDRQPGQWNRERLSASDAKRSERLLDPEDSRRASQPSADPNFREGWTPTFPALSRRVANPPNDIDRSIADVVTKLLSAGDRRVRTELEPALRKLLEQRFDTEQEAREAMVKELDRRVREARSKVEKRKQDRTRIVNDQLQRMMCLPEDNVPEGDPTFDEFRSSQRD